jgi:hypothetical protein
MKYKNKSVVALAAATALLAQLGSAADCTIAEASRALDPVVAGYCESDAVFIGTVESRVETERSFRPEGAEITRHFLIETSTMRISRSFKGELPETVEMIVDLYDKKAPAYSFQRGKEYLVFAKQLSAANRFAGATASCSVQPTLPIAEAGKALEKLGQISKKTKASVCMGAPLNK